MRVRYERYGGEKGSHLLLEELVDSLCELFLSCDVTFNLKEKEEFRIR